MRGIIIACIAACVHAVNPFAKGNFYVNPSFQAELDGSISTATGTTKAMLQKMRTIPSAYWLDRKEKILGDNTTTAEGILKDAAGKTVVMIVYDLPNRDCDAKASNGQICCTKNQDGTCNYEAAGDCSDGINEYKNTYIDPLAKLLSAYQDTVNIILIVEPDSVPNLATNQANAHCGNAATNNAYMQGVPYAVNTIAAQCPKCTMYLDAAHGGWLGWENSMVKFKALIEQLDILDKLQGFATNTANYQPTGTMCPWQPDSGLRNGYCLSGRNQGDACCADPCKLEGQYNPANNEANFVQTLSQHFPGKTFIIDTGRNGVTDMREDCANWCNIRGAGLGMAPTSDTGDDLIDAYYWNKTPGECDGCTQTLPTGLPCPRFDAMCGGEDSIGSRSGEPRTPEAGRWFDYGVKQLAMNGHMYGMYNRTHSWRHVIASESEFSIRVPVIDFL